MLIVIWYSLCFSYFYWNPVFIEVQWNMLQRLDENQAE